MSCKHTRFEFQYEVHTFFRNQANQNCYFSKFDCENASKYTFSIRYPVCRFLKHSQGVKDKEDNGNLNQSNRKFSLFKLKIDIFYFLISLQMVEYLDKISLKVKLNETAFSLLYFF